MLWDAGIVRNCLKILAAVTNAQKFLAAQEEFGSFDAFIWCFVEGSSKQNCWRYLTELPTKTPGSIQ